MTQKIKTIPFLSEYKRGLFWMLIDSTGSQGLVLLFHLLYRSYGGSVQHGNLGCLLSLIYLATTLANIGLDNTLAPFFEIFTLTRSRFRLCVYLMLIPQILFLVATCGISMLYRDHITALHFLTWLTPSFSDTICFYTLLIFFFESIRKTLRIFLQLCFYFQSTAFIELLGVILNIVGLYILHQYNAVTLPHMLQVLLYASCTQLLLLLCTLTIWHRTLPQAQAPSLDVPALVIRISKTRLFSWILACLHQIYSGNFLVPLCAFHFGIESASLMKVITSISSWITLITKKALGVTSNALLAHLKSRSQGTQSHAFHFLSEVFNQVLYALAIFLAINGYKILLHQAPMAPTITWSLLYGMIILTFLEGLFVLYETWYILEEDAHIYLLFNVMSIGFLFFSVTRIQAPYIILSVIICTRMLTFIALSLFSFYRWNIWPSFRPHSITLILSAIIAGICYYLL